jgi:hypothetical protein
MLKSIKVSFVFICVIVSLLSSCKKKSSDPTPSTSGSSPVLSATQANSYFPLTTNSTWSYKGASFSYTVTVTGSTKVINGITCYQIKELADTSNTPTYSYVYQTGNKYYEISYNELNVGGTPFTLKMIDLDLAVGSNWVSYDTSNQYTLVSYTGQVTGTGLTRTVNGITYNNVISVQQTTSAAFTPAYIATLSTYLSPSEIQSLESSLSTYSASQVTYFALGVGFIEQTSTTTSALDVQLISSSVK